MLHRRLKMKVISVDDHPVVRDGFRVVPKVPSNLEVVLAVALGRQPVRPVHQFASRRRLMNIPIPQPNDIEATQQIHAASPC